MNTERTEKFVNAIACDLEEGGFRQVSGTMLRRTLATAVSAALPLLPPAEPDFDVEAMLAACVPGGNIVDPQMVADNIRAWVADWKPVGLVEQQGGERERFEAWAETILGDNPNWRESGNGELARQTWQAALAATGKQQVGEVSAVDPSICIHKFGVDGRVCLRCKWDFRANGAPPQQVGEVQGDALPPLSADEVAAMAPAGLTWDETGAWAMGYEACRKAALAARQPEVPTFQAGVSEWMSQCFVPSLYRNMTERGDRLLEEVLELLQAHGYDQGRVATLVNYVFHRPVGEPSQEVGGVMVTLAGYCWVAGLDMHAAGDAELRRITQPDVMDKIRRKQEAKNALHFDTPLPGHAAPPAQGIDLGRLPDGWSLRTLATCYQLSDGNQVVANLVGPDAERNAQIIAILIDDKRDAAPGVGS